MMTKLLCPICQQKLVKEEQGYRCLLNHNYDLARCGYLNLLLNKANSGDNKLMIEARSRFLNNHYYDFLAEAILKYLKDLKITSLLDVGCGEGYFTRYLSERYSFSEIYGLDISKTAIMKASKKSQIINYIVASCYQMPLSENSFDLLLNVFAPFNETEVNRVSKQYFLKVMPGKKHLQELKEMIYEHVIIHEEENVDLNSFIIIDKSHLLYKIEIADVNDLYQMTPYYYKSSHRQLNSCLMTCDFWIVLYQKK